MSPQIIIQAILVIAVVAIGWTMLRSPGGARHRGRASSAHPIGLPTRTPAGPSPYASRSTAGALEE